MDRLVDEAEGLAVDGSSSMCSGAAGGRLEVTAEQQLGLLNSITASDLTGEFSAFMKCMIVTVTFVSEMWLFYICCLFC